jgi:hypothetical protein
MVEDSEKKQIENATKVSKIRIHDSSIPMEAKLLEVFSLINPFKI